MENLEPHKEDLGSDSRDVRETFKVPTSDDYEEATPDAFVGVDPVTKKRYELYPRQRRALGRMLQAEKGDIVFEEREWEQVDFKAVGIVAEEATRKTPCRGGVLADVMVVVRPQQVLHSLRLDVTLHERDPRRRISPATLVLVRGVLECWREFQSYLSFQHHFVVEVLEQQLALSLTASNLDITTRIRILNSRFALEHRYPRFLRVHGVRRFESLPNLSFASWSLRVRRS